MTLFLIITLTSINIILWIVFLVKFRKLFTTDDIIAKTRSEMNNMIADINRNASRNIDLLDDRTKKLRALIAEADKRIETAEAEKVRNASASLLQTKIKTRTDAVTPRNPVQRAAEKYRQTAEAVDPAAAFEVTEKGVRGAGLQQDLFSGDGKKVDTSAKVVVNPDGSSFAEIPVIAPTVYFSETPVVHEKTFNQKVNELYNQGYTADQISKELSCSLTEVQFVIDMSSP